MHNLLATVSCSITEALETGVKHIQDLTFSQVMYSQSDLGEVATADLPPQLVEPHPPSKRQVVHHPLRMGQVVGGLPKSRVLRGLLLLGHVLLGLQPLFPLRGQQGDDLLLRWRRLQVSPWGGDDDTILKNVFTSLYWMEKRWIQK